MKISSHYVRVFHCIGLIVCSLLLWSYLQDFFVSSATPKIYVSAAMILATALMNLVGVVRPKTFMWH